MSQSPAPGLIHLDHLVLTVRNIDDTVAFYTGILGLRAAPFTVADGSTRMALRFGTQKINLHEAGRTFDPKAAHPTPGSADLCFLTGHALADWQQHLGVCNIPIEDGPVRRTGAERPLMSIYIRDPDGNLIEISQALD